jgi:hypothetical protein
VFEFGTAGNPAAFLDTGDVNWYGTILTGGLALKGGETSPRMNVKLVFVLCPLSMKDRFIGLFRAE